jgi:hypothetical protein
MTRLEKISNVAVIAVAAVVIRTNLYDRFVPRQGPNTDVRADSLEN